MWALVVESLRVVIFGAAHLCAGSLGAGVIAVSLAARVALLPLTLRLARHSLDQQRRLAAARPALDELRRRHGRDPVRLFRETQLVHQAHGILMATPLTIFSLAVQLPLLGGLFAAVRTGLGVRVRFLWLADLARPDAPLVALVVGLTAVATAIGTPTAPASVPALLPVLVVGAMTLLVLWSAPATVALSVGGGAVVQAVQGILIGRERARLARP